MEKIIQSMFLLIAFLVFFLLFILKVYNLENNEKRKYGFLTSVLLLLFTSISCGSLLFIKKKDRYKNLNIDSAQFDKTQTYQDLSVRMQELNRMSEWKNLKIFWKKLNLIEPSNENINDLDYYEYIHTDSLGVKEAENLRQEMAGIFGYKNYNSFREEILYNVTEETKISSKVGIKKLVLENTILPLEMKILAKVCDERLNYISIGFSSMLTRMMPSRIVTEKDNSIADLEHKIDLLIALRNNGKVDKDEFEVALGNIQNEIETFLILDAIKSNYLPIYGYSYGNIEDFNESSEIEEYVAIFEQHYINYKNGEEESFYGGYDINEIDKMYLKTRNEIEEIKKVLPSLRELIADLER
ncbi:MAG: hypothetical protein KAI67_04310 [Candidatus Pacebacteria bacterium]|nr:hypothetical protein [Candidatus Paceibacterota bacterium]